MIDRFIRYIMDGIVWNECLSIKEKYLFFVYNRILKFIVIDLESMIIVVCVIMEIGKG